VRTVAPLKAKLPLPVVTDISPRQAANNSRGIELLTAWNSGTDDGTDLVEWVAAQSITTMDDAIATIAGLVAMCGVLVMRLEQASRTPVLEILQDLARTFGAH
jgi:hypothetical protein